MGMNVIKDIDILVFLGFFMLKKDINYTTT